MQLPSWPNTKKKTCLCWQRCMEGIWAGPKAHFWLKILLFLLYTHISPLFWAQTDLNRRDHIIPMYWGNFGYLRFSNSLPFGWSAGCFSAPIAQNYPWQGQKCQNSQKSFFGGLSLKSILVLGNVMFKVLLPHFACFFVHFCKLIRRPPGILFIDGCFCLAAIPKFERYLRNMGREFLVMNQKISQMPCFTLFSARSSLSHKLQPNISP